MFLGVRIAVQRKKLGISQADLARRLCISSSAIGMYEQGRREPSAELLVALSRELQVSTDYLLKGQDWTASSTSCFWGFLLITDPSALNIHHPAILPLSSDSLQQSLEELLRTSLQVKL